MKYLLDTNVCIKYLNGSSKKVLKKISRLSPDDIALCSVVKSELLTGAYKSNSFKKVYSKLQVFFKAFRSAPFDDNAALEYAKIRSNLEKQGKKIGPYDLQIASIAVTNKLVLITHNVKEFS